MEIRPVSSRPVIRHTGAPHEEQCGPVDSLGPALPERVRGGTFSGDVRAHRIHSDVLGNTRDMWVYLPPAYFQEPDRRFPVLYVHDGQNVFNRETSFGGVEWGVDEAAEEGIRSGRMQDVIIVAVANAQGDRENEYTPVANEHGRGGNAAAYGRFLVDEVKPFIDSQYRTLTDAAHTGTMGSSLGGLVSLWLGFNHPGVFGTVGALSPSLWWAGRDMIDEVAQHSGPQPQAIWLDMGDQESDDDDNHNGLADTLENNRDLGQVLLDHGYELGTSLHYHEIPGASHDEASWAARVGDVMATLYPRNQR